MYRLSTEQALALEEFSDAFVYDGAVYGRFGLENIQLVDSREVNPTFNAIFENTPNMVGWTLDALENGGYLVLQWNDEDRTMQTKCFCHNQFGEYILDIEESK